MVNPPLDDDGSFGASIAALREAWVAVIAGLRAIPDPQARFDAATGLGKLARQMESEAVEERAAAAVAIQDAESLTLTALAGRISMSKQRAGRLTGKARKPAKE